MGPIQTAINQLIGTTAAAVGAGKRFVENEKQARIKADKEAAEAQRKEEEAAAAEQQEADEAAAKAAQEKKAAAEQLAADKKEAAAVATEADLMNLGASAIEAKAYRLAQERGLANPKRIMYDEKGNAIATYEEMAQLLADQSLSGSLTSKLKGKEAVKTRRQLLEGKTHKERVENAFLSIGGGK